MAKITRKDVEHVAHLARLQLSEKEIVHYTEQLEKILEYVGKLQKLDTRDVPVTAQVSGLSNVARADAIAACPPETRERLLKEMPEREGDLLKTTGVFA